MISVKEAKEISLMKWEGELNNSNTYKSEIDALYPEAKNHYFCGFCLRHGYRFSDNEGACTNCEIALSEASGCLLDGSLYNIIEDSDSHEETQELIKELIQIIKNIPDE